MVPRQSQSAIGIEIGDAVVLAGTGLSIRRSAA
jgi:hypothetical protein